MHILFLTAEQWPTFRADITALFGRYLPRLNITCDLVTERDSINTSNLDDTWPAGKAVVFNIPKNRAAQYFAKFWHQCRVLFTTDYSQYQAIQVRDMTAIALVALIVAKIKGLPFLYWLSYPQSEGQVHRAKARGPTAGMRYWFPLLQGSIGQWLLYKVILPNSQHVFVQSEQMKIALAAHGIPLNKMTPVPMGVDLEFAQLTQIKPSDDARLSGKRVLIYLGTQDRVRKIEVLFEMLAIIKHEIPNVLLLLVGDTEDAQHRQWLKDVAVRLEVNAHILWLGWVPMLEGWRYVRAAELGLSPLPRSYLLDMASPTKAAEYMALGLPVIANDSPDQVEVINNSNAGLCVPLSADSFARAVMDLLNNRDLQQKMSEKGQAYVANFRSYSVISKALAIAYYRITLTERN